MSRWAVAAMAAMLAVGAAGCGGKSAEAASGRGDGKLAPQPAAAAGGACEMLDYGTIEKSLGVRFEISAAAHTGETYTCVVQQRKNDFPDLVISVTSTGIDETVFAAKMLPQGSAGMPGLGRAAYSVNIAATDQVGAGFEVGWLSAAQRTVILRFRTAPGTPDDQAAGFGTRLADLAKAIEAASA